MYGGRSQCRPVLVQPFCLHRGTPRRASRSPSPRRSPTRCSRGAVISLRSPTGAAMAASHAILKRNSPHQPITPADNAVMGRRKPDRPLGLRCHLPRRSHREGPVPNDSQVFICTVWAALRANFTLFDTANAANTTKDVLRITKKTPSRPTRSPKQPIFEAAAEPRQPGLHRSRARWWVATGNAGKRPSPSRCRGDNVTVRSPTPGISSRPAIATTAAADRRRSVALSVNSVVLSGGLRLCSITVTVSGMMRPARNARCSPSYSRR